jgi:hypothetical protein
MRQLMPAWLESTRSGLPGKSRPRDLMPKAKGFALKELCRW